MRSNVSWNVFTMNQNTPPTSRRKLRVRWPIPWATRTGGWARAFAMAGNLPSLRLAHQGTTVCPWLAADLAKAAAVACSSWARKPSLLGNSSTSSGATDYIVFDETRESSQGQLLLCFHVL